MEFRTVKKERETNRMNFEGDFMHHKKEFLSVKQLAAEIPFSEKGIYHLISEGYLTKGVHYKRPTGERSKVILKWSAICEWIDTEGAVPVNQKSRMGRIK